MIKRIFDVFVSLLALCLFAPMLIIIAYLVRTKLGTPIFFRQVRAGIHGKPFAIIKFRTMRNCSDLDGKLLSDAERLTKFGKILRSTSLDELPELYNVIKGDMSIVGPRPLLMDYLPLYNTEQAKRHQVRPGITGYAQINGRNAISWTEKFKLDTWYVENHSFGLDIKIIFKTVRKVILRDGISAGGEATMSRFTGTRT